MPTLKKIEFLTRNKTGRTWVTRFRGGIAGRKKLLRLKQAINDSIHVLRDHGNYQDCRDLRAFMAGSAMQDAGSPYTIEWPYWAWQLFSHISSEK